MSNEDEQPTATLEVIPNPRTFERPYRVQLTDELTHRTPQADFDLNLRKLEDLFMQDEPERYGEYLYQQVFRQSVDKETGEIGKVAKRLHEMLRHAEDTGNQLRLKLKIAATLPELQRLAWEYLFDAGFDHETGLALAADRRLTLFRDIDVDAPKREAITGLPSVLAAVICPSEESLAQFNRMYGKQLEPIALEDEEDRLEKLFKTVQKEKENPAMSYQILPTATGPGLLRQSELTEIDRIVEAMEDGKFHVLHLSCHGVILNNEAYLVLADAEGRFSLESEKCFAEKFGNMAHLRLILLDACHSAQPSEMEAYSGMAPQLIYRRVPAAIGMQRVWYTELADDHFIRGFYKELFRHGSVDRALQRARRDLRRWKPEGWEWGTPVLYLRLGEGKLFQRIATPAAGRPARHGGTGLYIGRGAKLTGVEFDVKAAGEDIVEGFEGTPQVPDKLPGEGIHIEDEAELEDTKIGGEFAGGSIYTKAMAAQARERYTQEDRDNAIRDLMDYYRRRLTKLKTLMEEKEEATKARMRAEICDIREEIGELERKLP